MFPQKHRYLACFARDGGFSWNCSLVFPGCTKVPDLKSESKAFTSLTKYFKISSRNYFSSAVGNSQSIWLQTHTKRICSKKLARKFHPTQVKCSKHISNWKKNFKIWSARKSYNYQYCQLYCIVLSSWRRYVCNYEKEMNPCNGQNGNWNKTMQPQKFYFSSSLHNICPLLYFFSGVLVQETTTVTGNQLSWDFRVGLYTWLSLDYLKHFIE